MKNLFLLIVLASVHSCVAMNGKLHLEARATRVDNYNVHFWAKVSNDLPRSEKYYCLDQLWEFGDGHSVLMKENCSSFERIGQMWIIRPGYHFYYKYSEPGKYKASFSLLKNGKQVLQSNKVDVYIGR